MVPASLVVLLLGSHAPAGEGVVATLSELQLRFESGSTQAKEFEILESEANAYLRAPETGDLPEGIENPWVRFEDAVAVVGATVDLDQFRTSLPDSMIFQLLSGRVPVEVTARFSGEKGVGNLVLERVLFAGIELPSSLVALMAQSPKSGGFLPPGFRLGEPFPLPLDLESVRCVAGAVRLRQGPTAKAK